MGEAAGATIKAASTVIGGAAPMGMKSAGRGVYRKKEQRAAVEAQPCAWKIGDRKSFDRAKAKVLQAILFDLDLTGHEKAALGECIGHMNQNERWSCFASPATIASQRGICERVVWNAIAKADTIHILTKRGKRPTRSKYAVVYITIHPNYMHTHAPSSGPKLGARLCTNKVHTHATEPSLREPSIDKKGKNDLASEKRNGKEKGLSEKVRGKEPLQSATPKSSAPLFFNDVPGPAIPRRKFSADDDETVAAELAASLERLESAKRGRLQ
jgi:hypothetical protein